MAYDNRTVQRSAQFATFEEGLRGFMQRVFVYMALGLGVTGLAAFVAATNPAIQAVLYAPGMIWVTMLAPLAMVFFLSFRVNSMSFSAAQTTFWIYAALVGLSITPLLMMYQVESVARIFFITASVFGSMALYGYTTKKDLTSLGSFMFMGLIGVIIASLVNIFMQSSMMTLVTSALSVIIFTGLTAYDVQKLKDIYYQADSPEASGKMAVMGALNLYLDFINLFLALLRLFGNRRD